MRRIAAARIFLPVCCILSALTPAVQGQPLDNRGSTGLEGPEFHRPALGQRVERPSLPEFPYAPGYRSGITHYLRGNGIFWSVISERTHPNKRDTEGDIVQCPDGSLLLAWSDFYT